MSHRFRRTVTCFLLLLSFSLEGCLFTRQWIGDSAVGLFKGLAQSIGREQDILLVRQSLPAYLLLLDSLIASHPNNQELLLAAAQAYGAYASSLEEEETERAALLLKRAKDYALKALELNPLFQGASTMAIPLFQERVQAADKTLVPLLFNVANTWASWIAQGSDGPEGMADLPRVESMMQRVLELDPGYFYGGPHLFQAVLLSLRPPQYGGDLKKAEYHFQQALKYAQDKFLMTQVYYAQYYARQRLDRDLFVNTLNRVLTLPADTEPDLTLFNTLAKAKAKKLLSQTEELF